MRETKNMLKTLILISLQAKFASSFTFVRNKFFTARSASSSYPVGKESNAQNRRKDARFFKNPPENVVLETDYELFEAIDSIKRRYSNVSDADCQEKLLLLAQQGQEVVKQLRHEVKSLKSVPPGAVTTIPSRQNIILLWITPGKLS